MPLSAAAGSGGLPVWAAFLIALMALVGAVGGAWGGAWLTSGRAQKAAKAATEQAREATEQAAQSAQKTLDQTRELAEAVAKRVGRDEWFRKFQFALGQAMSGEAHIRKVGLGILSHLVDDPLATDTDREMAREAALAVLESVPSPTYEQTEQEQ